MVWIRVFNSDSVGRFTFCGILALVLTPDGLLAIGISDYKVLKVITCGVIFKSINKPWKYIEIIMKMY